MRTIVIYYSYEGNTKLLAENIADEIGAVLLEIQPEKEMTSKGFLKYMWGGSQVTMGRKPKLKPISEDLADYDLLVIGTPVWAWSPAPPIKSFLEDHLPKGKRIAFFCSNEGGLGKTFEKMKEMAKGSKVIDEFECFAPLKKDRDASLERTRKWARGIITRKGTQGKP